MELVIKVSTDYTENTIIAQFINPIGLKFNRELVNSGSLSFQVSITDLQLAQVIEFKKVALYAIDQGEDKPIWTGYISEIVNDFAWVYITCGDEKDFMRNKIISGSRDWMNVNLVTVLSSMVSEANQRKGTNELALSYLTDSPNLMVKKKFSYGVTFFDAIREITEALGLEWKVFLNKIIVKQSIGIDRSVASPDYFEFVWNNQSPIENNITKFKNTRWVNGIATWVIGKASGGGVSVISGDKSLFGSIERVYPMDDGDVQSQTQEYVNKHQTSQLEREFEVQIDAEEAINVDVGDLVKIRIIHGSPLVDADTAVKIIEKTAVFENKVPTITIKVATETKEVKNMANFLTELNRRLRRVELY